MKKLLESICLLICCFTPAFFEGCHCEDGNDEDYLECLEIKELLTSEVPPAGVRTVFQLLDCDGYPIPDLSDEEIEVLLDGEPIRTEGDVASVLTQEVNFASYALLLLDMSDSIVDAGGLTAMLEAARNLVHKLVADGSRVAVYRFAGPQYFAEVQEFTAVESELDDALEELSLSDGLGTTDLYGSIPKALNVLTQTGDPDILTTKTLVVFTDGSDEAMAATRKSAEEAVNSSEANVFTVGLGGDVDQEELVAFGKDGFEWAEDAEKLDQAFDAVRQRIVDLSRSHYLLGVCSPRAGSWHDLSLVVRRGSESGRLDVFYDASGFDIVGCDAEDVAFPCREKQCGDVGGISCGTCSGTTYCSGDLICEEACLDEIECGVNLGVDCGDCKNLGETFACEEHACRDVCEEAECGTVLGIDCGDCSERGETFACNGDHECRDACETAECGTVLGVDCGDCSERGDDFGCNGDHACVEACAEADCGTMLGVDCGDCSAHGGDFGCDENNVCVDACVDAECGTIMGVDCGECANGFQCGVGNRCVPDTLPGVSWIDIPGGDFTLGCDIVLDPSCGLDEARRQVKISDFWIMETEVTVDMYRSCVSDGACNATYVNTSSECNYGESARTDHPINCLAWEGLKQFCAYAGGRIPTEAEWERAFRGDHDGAAESYWIYPWGNSPAPSCDRVVMNEDGPGCGDGATAPSETTPATSFGLANMGGNVSEWTADWYGETSDDCGGASCADPQGPLEGDERVVRGGAFVDMYASAFRTASRDKENPTTRSPAIGGRCVKSQ